MSAAALTLRGSFWFGEKLLFNNLALQLAPAQWTCILGQSGIGKSTVLRLLAGLPAHGRFDGSIQSTDGGAAPDRIAYMAQSDMLAPWLDVSANVLLGSRLRGESPDVQQADDLIERVGLAEHRHKRPAQLSGGMRQRAALARTLMEDAGLVLLDEPFSALDARTRAEMQELTFDLLKDATVVLATHDPAEAARLADQILIMGRDELSSWPTPAGNPIRATNDPQTLSAQAQLLDRLRQLPPQ